jgi:hypothetical protein
MIGWLSSARPCLGALGIAQDDRLAFFSKAMPESSGKHSLASKYIDTKYGKKFLFCGEEDNVVTKAHIVAGNQSVDYSAFSKPAYKDNLDLNETAA